LFLLLLLLMMMMLLLLLLLGSPQVIKCRLLHLRAHHRLRAPHSHELLLLLLLLLGLRAPHSHKLLLVVLGVGMRAANEDDVAHTCRHLDWAEGREWSDLSSLHHLLLQSPWAHGAAPEAVLHLGLHGAPGTTPAAWRDVGVSLLSRLWHRLSCHGQWNCRQGRQWGACDPFIARNRWQHRCLPKIWNRQSG
jgi:hypothetical protein